jgi:hypothetical protein
MLSLLCSAPIFFVLYTVKKDVDASFYQCTLMNLLFDPPVINQYTLFQSISNPYHVDDLKVLSIYMTVMFKTILGLQILNLTNVKDLMHSQRYKLLMSNV